MKTLYTLYLTIALITTRTILSYDDNDDNSSSLGINEIVSLGDGIYIQNQRQKPKNEENIDHENKENNKIEVSFEQKKRPVESTKKDTLKKSDGKSEKKTLPKQNIIVDDSLENDVKELNALFKQSQINQEKKNKKNNREHSHNQKFLRYMFGIILPSTICISGFILLMHYYFKKNNI